MASDNNVIEVKYRVRTKEAQAELQRLAMSLQGVETASTRTGGAAARTGKQMRGISKASKNAGRDMGMLVNTVAETAYSFSTAIPAMRGVGMQMAMMGGNAVTMGAAFGTLGVAVGVIVGLLPSLISLFSDTGESAEEASEGVDNATKSLRDYISEAKKAKEEGEQLNELLRGQGSVVEQQGLLNQRRDQLREARDRARERLEALAAESGVPMPPISSLVAGQAEVGTGIDPSDFGGLRSLQDAEQAVDDLRRATRDLASAERLLDEARETAREQAERNRLDEERTEILEEHEFLAEQAAEQARELEERRRRAREAAEEEADRQVEALRVEQEKLNVMMMQEVVQLRIAKEKRVLEREGGVSFIAGGDPDAGTGFMSQSESERIIEDLNAQAEAWEDIGQRVRDEMQRTVDGYMVLADIGIDALSGLSTAVIEGDLAALDSFLESFAQRNALRALEELARGIATSYINPPEAATHYAAAAAHGAAAVAAGGAALAIDSSGASGNAGSSGPDSSQATSGGGGDGGGDTYIIQFNSPTTDAERGRMYERDLRRAKQRGISGMSTPRGR